MPWLTAHLLRRAAFNHLLPGIFWMAIVALQTGRLVEFLREDAGFGEVARQIANVTFIALMMALFFVRRDTVGRRPSVTGTVVALAGSFALVLIVGHAVVHHDSLVLGTGTAVVLIGIGWSIVSLTTLGRNFGLLPDVRGLVTRGPYRLCRHPLYLGEIIAGLGLLIPIATPLTVAVFAVFVLLQLWRSLNEERALTAVFPEYEQYRLRTRRLIPFVW